MILSDSKDSSNESIACVISVENPFNDYYVIKLKPAQGVDWEPGEYGIFTLSDMDFEGKNWRGLSFASIKEEGVLLIGTRTGECISGFKRTLISLNEGDNISLRGPFGGFKIQDNTSPMVLFAGGVGITPIRALFKALENDTTRPIELVYASSDKYLFGEELEMIAHENPQITLNKTVHREDTIKKVLEVAGKYGGEAYYYISGSMSFVSGIKKIVIDEGISGNRVINDIFIGY